MADKPAKPGEDVTAGGEPPKKSRRKLLVVVAVILVAAGAYVFMGKGKGGGKPAAPEPGAVVRLDAINVNLAGGHYLKLGLAIQATKSAGEEPPEGAKVLDAAIDLFSNRSMAELSSTTARDKAKAELSADAVEQYPGQVIEVLFTEFVMQ